MADERRQQLADLPFEEKLKILDRLRERSEEIASAGLRKKPEPQPPAKPSKKS